MMRGLNVFAVAAAGGGASRQVKGGRDGLRNDCEPDLNQGSP